jgi:hypothetical protein
VHAAVVTPSQAPPQAEPSEAHAGRPTGAPTTGVQAPARPARLHASHWPPQAPSQQTPSTQKPVAHWLAAVQAAPGAALGTHAPAEHQAVPAQSRSEPHVALQAVAPHA